MYGSRKGSSIQEMQAKKVREYEKSGQSHPEGKGISILPDHF